MQSIEANESISSRQAFGRLLEDFRIKGATTPHGLKPAEENLLEKARQGEWLELSPIIPEHDNSQNSLRAGFVRFLALGGDSSYPVHEKGVQLRGALVEGDIDLDTAIEVRPIRLFNCRIQGQFVGDNADLVELALDGSRCRGISCDRARIRGNVFLRNGFIADGKISFVNAEVGGAFVCSGGFFRNIEGASLACTDIRVAGGVFLDNGFVSEGEARFARAQVQGQFACHGGRFVQRNRAPIRPGEKIAYAEMALYLQDATISGILFLGPGSESPDNVPVQLEGSLSLSGAKVRTLLDHPNSWPIREILCNDGYAPCVIFLDGFTYERFIGQSPTDSRTRQNWLLRQPASYLGNSFRPLPFEQLISVLRTMGHEADARRIGLFKYSLLRPIRTRKARWYFFPFVWATNWAWGLSCGYGYRPHRLIVSLFALWLACAGLYKLAEGKGVFAPEDAQVWTSDNIITACQNQAWTRCERVAPFITFNPLIYSVDVMLPVIDLKQRSVWTPMIKPFEATIPGLSTIRFPGSTVRLVSWLENIMGAAGLVLIGAILSGLVKRE